MVPFARRYYCLDFVGFFFWSRNYFNISISSVLLWIFPSSNMSSVCKYWAILHKLCDSVFAVTLPSAACHVPTFTLGATCYNCDQVKFNLGDQEANKCKYFELDQIADLAREHYHLDRFNWYSTKGHVAKGAEEVTFGETSDARICGVPYKPRLMSCITKWLRSSETNSNSTRFGNLTQALAT